jgi:hypothetical protein
MDGHAVWTGCLLADPGSSIQLPWTQEGGRRTGCGARVRFLRVSQVPSSRQRIGQVGERLHRFPCPAPA